MDVVMPVFASLFAILVIHFSYWGSVTKQLEPGISDEKPVYASQIITALENKKPDLPEFIKKDRSVEYRYQHDWRRDYIALLQKHCTSHYGKQECVHCETFDSSTPNNCNCDQFTQLSASGEICLTFRAPSDDCDYHSKEHHFAWNAIPSWRVLFPCHWSFRGSIARASSKVMALLTKD